MKIVFLSLAILLSTVTPYSSNASTMDPKTVSKEMIQLNSYIKNINKIANDLMKDEKIKMDELHLMSQLFLDTAYQIKTAKKNQTFHQNFKSIIDDVNQLHKMSKKNKIRAALTQARSIENNCSKCHNNPN